MKILVSFIKLVLNIFFFIVYSFFSIVLVNFLYWLVLKNLWKTIPDSSDIVHLKMAFLVILVVLFITVLLRKYFYLSVCFKSNLNKVDNKKEKNVKPLNKSENNKKSDDDEIEIYINKEIK